jgi:RNase P subunit RPR2
VFEQMEVFEHLPHGLRHNLKEAINQTTKQHLVFLWKAAHAVSSSPCLSHSLSRRLVELSVKHSIHLPESVNDRLCSSCSAVLLPSITARIRVRPRSRRSKRKINASNSLTNEAGGSGSSSSSGKLQIGPGNVKNQLVSISIVCDY